MMPWIKQRALVDRAAQLTARWGGGGDLLLARVAKIVLIAALAAFAFVVTYDNIADYNSNYEFVRHVLSMDTTFPNNACAPRHHRSAPMDRGLYHHHRDGGLDEPPVDRSAQLALLALINAPAAAFNRAKVWAVAGLTLQFVRLVFRLPRRRRRILRHVAIARRGTGRKRRSGLPPCCSAC